MSYKSYIHLPDRTISPRGEVWVHKTNLPPPHFFQYLYQVKKASCDVYVCQRYRLSLYFCDISEQSKNCSYSVVFSFLHFKEAETVYTSLASGFTPGFCWGSCCSSFQFCVLCCVVLCFVFCFVSSFAFCLFFFVLCLVFPILPLSLVSPFFIFPPFF